MAGALVWLLGTAWVNLLFDRGLCARFGQRVQYKGEGALRRSLGMGRLSGKVKQINQLGGANRLNTPSIQGALFGRTIELCIHYRQLDPWILWT